MNSSSLLYRNGQSLTISSSNSGHFLCTLWTRFLSSFNMDRLRIFQIVNQSTSFLMNNSTFISFLSSHFTTSIQEKLGHSFNILLRNFFSQISFSLFSSSTSHKILGNNQQPRSLTLYNKKLHFLQFPITCSSFSIWYFIRMTIIRISLTNICLWPLRFSLRRQKVSLQHSPSPEPLWKITLMPINNKAGFF